MAAVVNLSNLQAQVPAVACQSTSAAGAKVKSIRPSPVGVFNRVLRRQQSSFGRALTRLSPCAALDDETIATSEKNVGADEEHAIYPSGEWPANFSMANYEDLHEHYAPSLFKKEAQPDTILADIMSTNVWTARTDTALSEVSHHFEDVTGLPVIDNDLKVVGVVSKKDLAKSSDGLEVKAGDVMTTPAVTIGAEKTVRDAAVLMLKDKVHRIPVVNEEGQLVGIVTRTDIFTALDGLPTKGPTGL